MRLGHGWMDSAAVVVDDQVCHYGELLVLVFTDPKLIFRFILIPSSDAFNSSTGV